MKQNNISVLYLETAGVFNKISKKFIVKWSYLL